MQRFGEKLRTLREAHGLSYRQFAAKLGYTHAHFANIEAGKTTPSADLILKIADFFNVSTDQLMRDDVELF